MGLKPVEFWTMQVKEFFLMLEECQEQRKNDFRQRVELVRAQTTYLVNIQIEPDKRLKPWELWPLEWDDKEGEEKEEEKRSDEDIEESNRMLMGML